METANSSSTSTALPEDAVRTETSAEEVNTESGTEEEAILIADTAPSDVQAEPTAAREEPPSMDSGEKEEQKKAAARSRMKLILQLAATLLATFGVIIWGSIAGEKIAATDFSIGTRLLTGFFGTGVTSVKGNGNPLNKIPSPPVEEGSEAGAAENETVPEADKPSGDAVALPVKRVDLSVKSDDVFAIINETPYTPDVISLYAEELKTLSAHEAQSVYGKDAPRVIILHTHGTESYLEGGKDSYSSNDPFRTYDTDKNVVAVGRAMAERLRSYGIGVIHIEEMFDGESYNEAYVKSAAELRRLLEEYPSVEFVFDVHRDAMFTSDGVNLAPTSPLTSDEGDAAQIMLVVGTDHAGAAHGEWEDNLSFALKLQKSILGVNGGIMRALNLRSASFNAQYAKGSVLVEVGAAGNSLDEAIRAAEIFADGAAKVICQ